MAAPRLECWHVIVTSSGRFYVAGEVSGHPARKDGTHIKTSPVRGAFGRVFATDSGSTYQLGTPNPLWLEHHGKDFNHEEPLAKFLPPDVDHP